ncbi:hypothetical protein GCM10027395_20850 [Giesbergeria sinuosa]
MVEQVKQILKVAMAVMVGEAAVVHLDLITRMPKEELVLEVALLGEGHLGPQPMQDQVESVVVVVAQQVKVPL